MGVLDLLKNFLDMNNLIDEDQHFSTVNHAANTLQQPLNLLAIWNNLYHLYQNEGQIERYSQDKMYILRVCQNQSLEIVITCYKLRYTLNQKLLTVNRDRLQRS